MHFYSLELRIVPAWPSDPEALAISHVQLLINSSEPKVWFSGVSDYKKIRTQSGVLKVNQGGGCVETPATCHSACCILCDFWFPLLPQKAIIQLDHNMFMIPNVGKHSINPKQVQFQVWY